MVIHLMRQLRADQQCKFRRAKARRFAARLSVMVAGRRATGLVHGIEIPKGLAKSRFLCHTECHNIPGRKLPCAA